MLAETIESQKQSPVPFIELDFEEIDVPIKGKSLRVRRLGEDKNPPILLQHGIQSHSAVWEKLARLLHESGFQVIMPDRRGHGLSDHFDSYHLLDYVADLNHILEYFCCNSINLIGHCESSMITTLLAGARPEKINQLINIQFPIPPRVPMEETAKAGLVRTFLQKMEAPQPHQLMKDIEEVAERSIIGAPFPMPIEIALHVAKRNARADAEGRGFTWSWDPAILNYRLLYNTFDMSIIATSLAKLSKPAVFIYGKDSTLIKTDKDRHLQVTQALCANPKQILVPGGHYPHMESHVQTLANVIVDCIRNNP
ncbi:MAG TPA: alpha/beta hydrolase [Cellvibrio sp.]|nr:alpha/beta hydrolase [Cellvibrio sp.]